MKKSVISASAVSKLSKFASRSNENNLDKKENIFLSSNQGACRTKSFRLRQADIINFQKLISSINQPGARKIYSESEILRGLINYYAEKGNIEHLMKYVKESS